MYHDLRGNGHPFRIILFEEFPHHLRPALLSTGHAQPLGAYDLPSPHEQGKYHRIQIVPGQGEHVPHGPGGGDGLLLFPQAAYRLDLIPDLGRPLKFHGFRRPDHVLGELFDDRLGMPFQKAAYALQQGMVFRPAHLAGTGGAAFP